MKKKQKNKKHKTHTQGIYIDISGKEKHWHTHLDSNNESVELMTFVNSDNRNDKHKILEFKTSKQAAIDINLILSEAEEENNSK